MKIVPFFYHDVDDLCANTYVLIDSDNNCVVIDPSSDKPGIYNYILKNNLKLKAVLLTHGHFDHMRGVDYLIDMFNCHLYIGYDDIPFLKEESLNCSLMCNEKLSIKADAEPLYDGQKLNMLNEVIVALHTPYHTEGSFSYFLTDTKAVFTGDSLFKGCIGRSDLPTSNSRTIRSTLEKLLKLPNDYRVYPGHGLLTSIGDEVKVNLFVK